MRKFQPPSGGFFSSVLFVLMLLATTCHAQFVVGGTPPPPLIETLVAENPTQVTFQRASQGDGTFRASEQVCYSYGCQSLPAWQGYSTGGGYLFPVWSTPRPAGAKTMWGTWTFQSGAFDLYGNPIPGLFGTNPNAHVAFLMRGVSTGSYNIGGAGYTVGNLSGFANSAPCPGPTAGAPETWWALDDATAGNVTWGGHDCSPPLLEHHPYTLTMQAAADGFAWWLRDATTGAMLSQGYESNANSPSLPIIQEATGTTIGIVFADTPGTSWTFQVWGMAFGWF